MSSGWWQRGRTGVRISDGVEGVAEDDVHTQCLLGQCFIFP